MVVEVIDVQYLAAAMMFKMRGFDSVRGINFVRSRYIQEEVTYIRVIKKLKPKIIGMGNRPEIPKADVEGLITIPTVLRATYLRQAIRLRMGLRD